MSAESSVSRIETAILLLPDDVIRNAARRRRRVSRAAGRLQKHADAIVFTAGSTCIPRSLSVA